MPSQRMRQPSATGWGWSAWARSRGGSRLAGTVCARAALAAAATTGADSLANRASAGSSPGLVLVFLAGGAAGMVAGGAATPRPWGVGDRLAVPTAAATAVAVRAAPRARLRPGRARSRGENRTGSSTSLTVARASAPAVAAKPRLAHRPRG